MVSPSLPYHRDSALTVSTPECRTWQRFVGNTSLSTAETLIPAKSLDFKPVLHYTWRARLKNIRLCWTCRIFWISRRYNILCTKGGLINKVRGLVAVGCSASRKRTAGSHHKSCVLHAMTHLTCRLPDSLMTHVLAAKLSCLLLLAHLIAVGLGNAYRYNKTLLVFDLGQIIFTNSL